MTHIIGVGVIGMGWMGEAHSRSYLHVPLHFPQGGVKPRLVICADNVAERAAQAQAVLGFEANTTDWRQVIEHPEVELVIVTTPNNLHVEIARAAAAAGKHIFCEKPVGRTPAETAEIAKIARAADIVTSAGYCYRWTPLVVYARNLIQAGKLGDLTHFRGRFFSMYGSNPYGLLSWRFDFNVAGYGVLGDIMAHVVDMAHLLVGPIKRVSSQVHTFIRQRPKPIPGKGTHYSVGQPGDPMGDVTNEDYIGAMVEFENGARGTLEVSRTIFGPKNQFAFELNGTKGAINWDFERMNELEVYLPGDNDEHDGYMRLVGGDQYPYHGNFVPGVGSGIGYEDLRVIEAYEFLQSVNNNRQHTPSFEDALAVAKVNAAMIRSWKSRQWEDVTPLL